MNKYEREVLFKRIADKEKAQREEFSMKAEEALFRARKEKAEKEKQVKEAKEDEARKGRHNIWKMRGQAYFNKMCRQEAKELEAKMFLQEKEARQAAVKKEEQVARVAKERERLRIEKESIEAAKAEDDRVTRTYPGGSMYKGEWLEEQQWNDRICPRHNHLRTPHGKGAWYTKDLEIQYVGDFFFGKKHGYGKYCWNSPQRKGESFEGSFYNDQMHGKGVLIGKDGSRSDVIYYENRKVANYSDLVDGRQIEIRLQDNPAGLRWHKATIERYDPNRKLKKHRIRIESSMSKSKWYDLSKSQFRMAKEKPMSYNLVKPESEHTENCIPAVARTDPLGNRKQFKQICIKKGFEKICPDIMSEVLDGNGNFRKRWRIGEMNYAVDGRAFAHSLDGMERIVDCGPRRPDNMKRIIQLRDSLADRVANLHLPCLVSY